MCGYAGCAGCADARRGEEGEGVDFVADAGWEVGKRVNILVLVGDRR
jgi:Na+-translocating ferredoxin:NAD+ oxidoreductase RNF subunit RnfB